MRVWETASVSSKLSRDYNTNNVKFRLMIMAWSQCKVGSNALILFSTWVTQSRVEQFNRSLFHAQLLGLLKWPLLPPPTLHHYSHVSLSPAPGISHPPHDSHYLVPSTYCLSSQPCKYQFNEHFVFVVMLDIFRYPSTHSFSVVIW